MRSQNSLLPAVTLQRRVQAYAQGVIERFPKRNNKTGRLKDKLDPNQHPNFLYPMPNPTIHASGGVAQLDPLDFQGLGSFLVVFAPDMYWDQLVTVRCPLCEQKASPHGWCPQLRRVCGLQHTYFVIGRRYRCDGCTGERGMQHHHHQYHHHPGPILLLLDCH